MPFRERLKSIVKGEAPVFGHHSHGHNSHHHHRRWSSVSHHDIEHLAHRPLEGRPQSHESSIDRANHPAHTEQTITTGTDNTYNYGQFLRPEDATMRQGRNEPSAPTDSHEARDGHILKDSIQDRGGREVLHQHHGPEAIVKDIDSLGTGGGGSGMDFDRAKKAPPPPPPTTASADRSTTAQTMTDSDPTAPDGTQQPRLEITPDGVIQDKQAIRESMIMDSGNVKGTNSTTESSKFSNTKGTKVNTNINSQTQSAISTTSGTEGRYSDSPPSPLHTSIINDEDLAAQGNVYTLPPSESNPFYNSHQGEISVTENPSEYSITRLSSGNSENSQDTWRTISPNLAWATEARVEPQFIRESKVNQEIRTSKQNIDNKGEDTGEYHLGSFANDSTTRVEDPAGTPRTVPRNTNTPSREFHIPMVADYGGDFTTKTQEHYPHSNSNIHDSSYSSPSTSISTSTGPRRYSTIHNILPCTYQIDPNEGPVHKSVILGGRSSSILSSNNIQNHDYTANLKEFGLDTNKGIYEITNFGGGERAPVMGVEEEGDWYKNSPERAGCFF